MKGKMGGVKKKHILNGEKKKSPLRIGNHHKFTSHRFGFNFSLLARPHKPREKRLTSSGPELLVP
jgi:hypothetical protein